MSAVPAATTRALQTPAMLRTPDLFAASLLRWSFSAALVGEGDDKRLDKRRQILFVCMYGRCHLQVPINEPRSSNLPKNQFGRVRSREGSRGALGLRGVAPRATFSYAEFSWKLASVLVRSCRHSFSLKSAPSRKQGRCCIVDLSSSHPTLPSGAPIQRCLPQGSKPISDL